MDSVPSGLPRHWISGRPAIGLLIAVVLVGVAVTFWTAGSGRGSDSSVMAGVASPAGTASRFAYLAAQHSNYCSLSPRTVMAYPDGKRMQGSCCNPMNQEKYDAQVAGLRRYAHLAQIPVDPYDVGASLAKELLGYDNTISLTAQQHSTFTKAMQMTDDKGPCCCQCWRWYMTEGLDKFLMSRLNLPARQVAEITDLTNGCGGR